MDIDKFIDRVFEAGLTVSTINNDHHGGKLTLKEKAVLLNQVRNGLKDEIREALDQEIDSALLIVNRYKNKYEDVQAQNHSVVMAGDNPLFYGGECKKNLDSDDKMVMFILKLINDDLSDLKDRT